MLNSKKKRLLFCIIIAIFAILFFSAKKSYAASSALVDGKRWYYTLNGDNATNVYSTASFSGTLTIPSAIAGHPVISVGNGSNPLLGTRNSATNSTVTSVVIPSSVTSINKNAFKNFNKLTTVSGMENVTDIDSYAFYNCRALTSVELKDGLRTIGSDCFENCTKLKSINIPNSVEEINGSAFRGCTVLESITLPSKLNLLGGYAFYGCRNLKGDVVIPSKVAIMGISCFQNCTNLDGSLKIESDKLIAIPDYAFSGCNKLKIALPSTVKSVGNYAFDGQKDIWVDDDKGNISLAVNFGGTNIPFVHYKNCKHNITVNMIDGVKIYNKLTGEEFTGGEFDCTSNFELEVRKDASCNYENLKIIKITEKTYANSDDIIEQLDESATINISSLLRNIELSAANLNSGLDLSLRQYIDKVNGNDLDVSRKPIISLGDASPKYKHSKYPVIVNKDDIVTYKIDVYNEGIGTGKVTKITEHLPEGLEFISDNETNIQYNWTISQDGRTVTTDYYKDYEFAGFTGISNPDVKTLEIVCKVTAEKDNDKVIRLTNIAEISEESDQDYDSTPNNANISNLDTYKFDDAINSNSMSFVKGQEDDDDFENVVILRNIPITYTLKISKVDNASFELLNGAKFDLLDSEGNVIQSGVTVNDGTLVFDPITTYDNGVDTYYIVETESPTGYKKVVEGTIKLEVVKNILDSVKETYEITVKCDVLESYVDTNVDETRVIPIYTVEQLKKMGSGETIEINGKEYKFDTNRDYRLMNDIDLSAEEWSPIKENITGIFDGNNKKIKGMRILDNSVKKAGLFAIYSGVIKDLTLDEVSINIDLSAEIALLKTTYTDYEEYEKELTKLLDSYNVGGFVANMKGGAFVNCTVNGVVKSDSNSVGGFVGYSEKGHLLIVKDCTNNSNVIGGSYNVGGIIGNSLSAVNMKNTVNNGTIVASKYNAGGLIGYQAPTEYTSTSTKIEYAENTNVVNVIVGNTKTVGYYKIKLRNLDYDTKDLIKGSTFEFCDQNKNPIAGLENLELKDGYIVLDPMKIESTGSDIYYIRQKSVPDGYKKIDEYLKSEINKNWDKEKSEYGVSDEKTPEDDSSKVSTGVNCEYTRTDGVSILSNKAKILNCKNTGNITATIINAGGIIGKSTGIIDIEESSNSGVVSSKGNAGGIIAEAEKSDDSSYLYIYNCSNEGTITQLSGDDSSDLYANTSGIVGAAKIKATILKIENNGIVAGINSKSAGIIATSEQELIVRETNNNGNISSNSVLGGIVGQFLNREEKFIISNCKNTAEISGSDHMGGIIGLANSIKTDISDCYSEGAKFISTSSRNENMVSAIVAITISDTNIENCIVKDTNISGRLDSEAGICAYAGDMDISGKKYAPTYININNCSTNNLTIESNGTDIGGIVAKIIDVNCGGIQNVKITNCTNEQINITDISEDVYARHYGLIAGYIREALDVYVDNCNSTNSNLNFKGTQLGTDAGACIGAIEQLTKDSNVKIQNCNIDKVDINSNAVGCIGGFVGLIQSSRYQSMMNVDIENCEFTNSKVIENVPENRSGTSVAGMIAEILEINDFNIKNCSVVNSEISSNVLGNNSYIASGMIGYVRSKSANFDNCNVNNCKIATNCGSAGGILADIQILSDSYGSYDFKTSFKDCNLIDTSIIGYNEEKDCGTKNMGGIVGQAKATSVKLDNCTVKGTDEKSIIKSERRIGSIGGHIEGTVESNNVIVSNIDLVSKYEDTIGGVYAMAGTIKDKDSKYTNISLTGSGTAGGYIGYTTSYDDIKVDINSLTFENISVENKDKIITGGIIGAVDSGKLKSEGNTYKNISVTVKNPQTGAVGGLTGYAQNIIMNNDNFDGIIIRNTDGGLDFAGGISGKAEYVTADNVNVSNADIEITSSASAMFGVVSQSLNLNTSSDTSKTVMSNIKVNSTQTSSSSYIATVASGVSGISVNGNIKNVTINGINLSTSMRGARMGGIAAFSDTQIDNCSVNNAEITSTYNADSAESTDVQMGGIKGLGNSSLITNCSVKDSKFNIISGYVGGICGSSAASITDSYADNIKINGTNRNYAGGILGHDNNTSATGKIDNCYVQNSSVNSANGNIGGIAGFHAGIVNKTDFKNSEIVAEGSGAFGIGGIVGQGNNVLAYNQNGTRITECNVIDSKISGNAAVGGIAGAAVPEITSCKVIGKQNSSSSTLSNKKLVNNNKLKAIVVDNSNKIVEDKTDDSISKEDSSKVDETLESKEKSKVDSENNEDKLDNLDDKVTDNELDDELVNKNNVTEDEKIVNEDNLSNDEIAVLSNNNTEDEDSDDESLDNNIVDVKLENNMNDVKLYNSNEINNSKEIALMNLEETNNSDDSDNEVTYTTIIKGNAYIGGLIGFGGDLSGSATYLAVTATDCTVENVYIEGRVDTAEDIGKHSVSSTLVDSVVNFVKNNVILKLIS